MIACAWLRVPVISRTKVLSILATLRLRFFSDKLSPTLVSRVFFSNVATKRDLLLVYGCFSVCAEELCRKGSCGDNRSWRTVELKQYKLTEEQRAIWPGDIILRAWEQLASSSRLQIRLTVDWITVEIRRRWSSETSIVPAGGERLGDVVGNRKCFGSGVDTRRQRSDTGCLWMSSDSGDATANQLTRVDLNQPVQAVVVRQLAAR